MRLLAVWCILLAAALAAGEEPPPSAASATAPRPAPVPAPSATTPAPPPAFSMVTGGGGAHFSMNGPSEAHKMRLTYEEVVIETETALFTTAVLPGATRPVLSTSDLTGGPDGRVLIDTSRSKLRQMAFRGVLRPRTVIVRRQDPDPARPKIVNFRVDGGDLGDVHGMVTLQSGDMQLLVWADRVVLDVEAVADPASSTGLGVPRLTAMHLYGRPAAPDVPERLVQTLLMIKPVPEAEATIAAQWDGDLWARKQSSDWMTLDFDAEGNLTSYSVGNKGEYHEREGYGMILRRQSSSVPTLGK